MTPATIAYRVLTAEEAVALAAGVFEGSAVDRADGFIHLSTAAQLAETVNVHFAGQDKLTVAAIDLGVLGAAVRWERSRNGQWFPHVYAPLTLDAVLALAPLHSAADGSIRCAAPGLP
jgi:uncharacterized protein (DUF952 family)